MPAKHETNDGGETDMTAAEAVKAARQSAPVAQVLVVDVEPKCNAINAANGARCGRVLAGKMGRPWEIRCQRCGTVNCSDDRQ